MLVKARRNLFILISGSHDGMDDFFKGLHVAFHVMFHRQFQKTIDLGDEVEFHYQQRERDQHRQQQNHLSFQGPIQFHNPPSASSFLIAFKTSSGVFTPQNWLLRFPCRSINASMSWWMKVSPCFSK